MRPRAVYLCSCSTWWCLHVSDLLRLIEGLATTKRSFFFFFFFQSCLELSLSSTIMLSWSTLCFEKQELVNWLHLANPPWAACYLRQAFNIPSWSRSWGVDTTRGSGSTGTGCENQLFCVVFQGVWVCIPCLCRAVPSISIVPTQISVLSSQRAQALSGRGCQEIQSVGEETFCKSRAAVWGCFFKN